MSIHSKCGGKIVNRICQKCGQKWGKIGYLVSQSIEPDGPKKFDPKEYRKRIRDGRDIP